MKKLFTFLSVLLIFSSASMADDLLNRIHPNEAGYKIEGDFSYKIKDDSVIYELTNVVPTGMDIIVSDSTLHTEDNERNVRKSDVFIGEQRDGREVAFSFNKVMEHAGHPGYDNISYWYFDEDINLWQPDVEIRKGEQNKELNKDITIMLIIDCSESLINDFGKVKDATLKFLEQMSKASKNGNLHIGIIGFSSMPDTKVFEMQPLTEATYQQMKKFVNNLGTYKGTALFYAWDKAVEQTQRYIDSGAMSNYDKTTVSSHYITFTDGIDQTSQDINRRPNPIVTADDYYEYIIKATKMQSFKYESDVVFVKGVDITNNTLQKKFENKLMQLAVPSNKNHFEVLESVDRLKDKFNEIAKRLTDSWKTLDCYVAPARHGHVCWTFGKVEKVVKKEKPAPESDCYKHLLVAGIGFDFGFGRDVYVGFDLDLMYAYQVKPKFGIGLYNGFGFLFYCGVHSRYYYSPSFAFQDRIGLTFTGGDICEKKVIFVGGLGADVGTFMNGVDLRAGFVTRKGFYMSWEIGLGAFCYYGGFAMDMSMHIGYNFGKLIKPRR